MLKHWFFRCLMIAFLLVCGTVSELTADQNRDLQRSIDATLAELAAGNIDQAVVKAEEALSVARASSAPDPQKFAYALNNLGYALSLLNQEPDRIEELYKEAISYLEDKDQKISPASLTVTANLAEHEARAGQITRAGATLNAFVDQARAGELAGQALGTASAFYFAHGNYQQASLLLIEMLSVEPDLLRPVYGDVFSTYSDAQEAAELSGRYEDTVALIRGKMAILRTFLPDQTDAIQTYLQSIFFHYHQAEQYGRAADTIREWGATGPLSKEDQEYIDEMASLLVEASQLFSYSAERTAQLGYADLAVAFTELLNDPNDTRLGHALREKAAAQTNLGLLDEAADNLRRAYDVMLRSEQGRESRHLLLADLASNAWLRGDYQQAADLFEQGDATYDAAIRAGAPAATRIDQVIDKTNRANLMVSLGRPEDALVLTAAARMLFVEDANQQEQKWNSRFQEARIEAAEALAFSEMGQKEEAISATESAVRIARETLPENHPDLALTLANAADLLFVLGQRERALRYAEDSVSIYNVALPPTMPNAIDAKVKLALFYLTAGDRQRLVALMRQITEARKSPAYRSSLSEAAGEFEILTWALLSAATSAGPGDIEEAFAALQWTQITRSAEAVLMMEERLKLSNPSHATLLRRRQNLLEQHTQNASRIMASYASGEQSIAEPLVRQRNRLERELTAVDTSLDALGLGDIGVSTVSPTSIRGIQGLLSKGEALITFALPSLDPSRIDGFDGSSNYVIVITSDETHVATIPEQSRTNLKHRVQSFRCEIAISDPDCRQGNAAALRGAMLTSVSETVSANEHYFDFDIAYGLYQDLFGGVEDELRAVDHLIIVPPPDLLRLPFQALLTSPRKPAELADADWMLRKFAISVLPSVPSFRALRMRDGNGVSQNQTVLGVGDPVIGDDVSIECGSVEEVFLRSAPVDLNYMAENTSGSGSFLADTETLRKLPRLPDAKCELRAIESMFDAENTSLLLGPDATELSIKQLNTSGQLSGFDVLVFATHGLTAGSAGARAPGLVLTPPSVASVEDDGLLTAAEIATLELGADLVVLSACNTAAGENGNEDGLSGLARAFFHSGASSLLVTHWSVYSEAAVKTSTGFFRELRNSPEVTKAEALRRALLRIIDNARGNGLQSHPSYWAAFAIVGAN